ncbi:MAG: hypothetical protein AAGC44_14680 [Planctomycetota bacterium]
MANTSIRLMCPNLRCRTLLAVPITARGKNVRCRLCGTRIQVPTKNTGSKPAPAQASAEPAEQED